MILPRRLLALALLTALSLAHSAIAQKKSNPLAKYAKVAEVDKFNPGPAGKTLVPKPGGTLTIRTPTDPSSMNPLNSRGAQAAEILAYLQSYLIGRHAETFEYLPYMAWKWEVRDQITLKDGKIIEGVILKQDDRQVHIAENAGRVTIAKCDVESYDAAKGTAKFKNGETHQGAITEYEYTIQIEPAANAAARAVPLTDVAEWTHELGGKQTIRPAVKEQVIYLFTIREGLTWNDGKPLKPEDFTLGLNAINNPAVDCAQLRSYYQDIAKLEILKPRTLKFTYRKPYFQAILFCGSLPPLPSHILQPEKYKGDDEGFGEMLNKHPMYLQSEEPRGATFTGCGPYQLVHWLKGKEVRVERNPHYWAPKFDIPYLPKEQPYLDEIAWTVIGNKTAAINELQKGAIDADFDIEPATWRQGETNTENFTGKIVRAKSIVPLYTYIGWNMTRDVFKSAKVRQALTMLIPREKILEDIHYGLGRVAYGPFFIDSPANDPGIKPLPYDPQTAKRQLRREGWIDRDGDGVIDKDGKPFEFEYMIHSGRDYHQKIADIMKENVEKAGIKVTIRKLDWTVFGQLVSDHNFDAVRFAWGATIDPDPYQIWHSSQSKDRGSNYVSYENPRIDEIIETVREEFDPEKRWELLREMHRIIHEDQPYSFLFCFDSLQFYNKRFRNVKFYAVNPGRDLTEWCANYEWK